MTRVWKPEHGHLGGRGGGGRGRSGERRRRQMLSELIGTPAIHPVVNTVHKGDWWQGSGMFHKARQQGTMSVSTGLQDGVERVLSAGLGGAELQQILGESVELGLGQGAEAPTRVKIHQATAERTTEPNERLRGHAASPRVHRDAVKERPLGQLVEVKVRRARRQTHRGGEHQMSDSLRPLHRVHACQVATKAVPKQRETFQGQLVTPRIKALQKPTLCVLLLALRL
mmetsp:Transcript_29290/g.73690  ORF Transcript_29290/g.73690 Transcript_29290/m.73690 type:complete len:227 (-) Transcript_29290:584-1264(-)